MDKLGDRMKDYEAREASRRFLPMLPVYARIDGRTFHAFTQGMDRPFDDRLISVMRETTRRLVDETDALVGYTQSDEISLLWYRSDPKSQIFFDGKAFKITSITAALATSIFTDLAREHWPKKFKRPVVFDCRVFQLPTKDEAVNAFIWRQQDATRNAISMAAQARFSHKKLHGVSCEQMQEMLFQEGVNFNDYPERFKRGSFVLRRRVCRELDPEQLARIPEAHRPTGPVERQVVELVDLPPLTKITNRVAVLFDGAEPQES